MKYDQIWEKLDYLYGKKFCLSQIFSRINTPPFLKSGHISYLPAYEDGTECSETSEYKIRTPEITQKKAYNIQNTAEVWNQKYLF